MKKILFVWLLTLVSSFGEAQKFYPDDPSSKTRTSCPLTLRASSS